MTGTFIKSDVSQMNLVE